MIIKHGISDIQWYVVLGSPAPSNLLAIRIGPCSHSDNNKTAISISEMSISTNIYDSTASGHFNITKDIENGWFVKATMQKCPDIRNLDTCDYFKSFHLIKDGCQADKLPEEMGVYTLLFRYTQPRLSCPIKAGNYKIIAYPFLMEDNYLTVSESKISTSVFGYTFRLEGFLSKEQLFCLETYMQLIYIRENNGLIDAISEPPIRAGASVVPGSEEDGVDLY